MAKQTKWGVNEKFVGDVGFFNHPDVPETAFYAVDEDGNPLKRGGKLVRLVQVDLAPDDADNGKQEFRIADKKTPAQAPLNIVELELGDPHAVGGK